MFHLVGEVRRGHVAVYGEPQCERHDVGQRCERAQCHRVPPWERQHGVHSEDDEQEEWHLREKG